MNVNEASYRDLVIDTYMEGTMVEGRNGKTTRMPGGTIKLDVSNNILPLITGRKMFYKGVIGEALTLMQAGKGPIHVSEFEKNGCNYWKLWADKDGYLTIDYPVREHFYRIIKDIKKDPYSRRHIIDLWNQDRIEKLSLPCCHTQYQFIVTGDYIHMIWTQRSADVMIGVPSDMILATIYLRIIAKETKYKAGTITMNFGDVHIYEEHIDGAQEYIKRDHHHEPKLYIASKKFTTLSQDDFFIAGYKHGEPIKFELKE
jgi:thymidylate synthase